MVARKTRTPPAFEIEDDPEDAGRFAADRTCSAVGCPEVGAHRAPKARDRLDEYFWFCLQHVRVYNARWDFFKGVEQPEIEAFQKANASWHRPTWKFNTGKATEQDLKAAMRQSTLFADHVDTNGHASGSRIAGAGIFVGKAEQKALTTLELEVSATKEDIRIRYKELVKRYHPDSNDGDRAGEERLQQVLHAYNYLKDRRSS